MSTEYSRRHILASASLAAAASLVGSRSSNAAEPPPETTAIRLRKSSVICFAPLYVIEPFLRAEGFETVDFVPVELGTTIKNVEQGHIDMDAIFAGSLVFALGSGARITTLGGLHVGCYELFAREPIKSIGDLKGRRVGISRPNSGNHIYLSIMAGYVGLDRHEDIEWVADGEGQALDMFAAGETDAYLGFPPEPQKLRERGINRVIINTITDKPWSQHYCCMIYGNREWVQRHPIATKRFLRAIYKAADFCTAQPDAAAGRMVDGGFAERYDHALETIESVKFQRWRDYDAEDTMRFYGLRLHGAGMITTTPNKIISEGTDWRFLNELKQELRI